MYISIYKMQLLLRFHIMAVIGFHGVCIQIAIPLPLQVLSIGIRVHVLFLVITEVYQHLPDTFICI